MNDSQRPWQNEITFTMFYSLGLSFQFYFSSSKKNKTYRLYCNYMSNKNSTLLQSFLLSDELIYYYHN